MNNIRPYLEVLVIIRLKRHLVAQYFASVLLFSSSIYKFYKS